MKSKYKAEWKPFKANKRFWGEVLKGRTITKLEWKGSSLEAIILDDGQRVFPTHGGMSGSKATFAIRD